MNYLALLNQNVQVDTYTESATGLNDIMLMLDNGEQIPIYPALYYYTVKAWS